MRFFQNNCFQMLYQKSNKKLLANFVELFALSSLSVESPLKSNKSYQWNFLKVVVRKCSAKGAMNSFFWKNALYIASYLQKVSENAMLKRNFSSTDFISNYQINWFYQNLSRSQRNCFKEVYHVAMSSSFRRAPCIYSFISKISTKM